MPIVFERDEIVGEDQCICLNHRMKYNIVGVRHERIDTTYVYIDGTWSFPVSDLENRCSFEGGIIL